MANLCDFNIRLKAPDKKTAYLMYLTQPSADLCSIYFKEQRQDGYYLFYTGCCKWSVDCYCEKIEGLKIDMSSIPELDEHSQDKIPQDIFDTLWTIPMEQKSKIFNVEFNVLSWSSESIFATFNIIKDGKTTDGNYELNEGLYVDYDDGEPFSCFEGDYYYQKDDYDSFEEFLKEEGLPSSLTLKDHFISDGDGSYYIKQIGDDYLSEPECDWTIK